jgi:hypothetical protein
METGDVAVTLFLEMLKSKMARCHVLRISLLIRDASRFVAAITGKGLCTDHLFVWCEVSKIATKNSQSV